MSVFRHCEAAPRMKPKQSQFLRLLRPHFVYCLAMTICLLSFKTPHLFSSEVLEETRTQVVIREHPRTGRSYVSIVQAGEEARDPFAGTKRNYSRPDYRILDPKIKSGKIPYDGPYSDKKKIYIFAASVATLGAASGAAVIAAAPAATGAAASGGAGAYLAGGTVVLAGSAVAAEIAMKPDPKKGHYTLRSQSEISQPQKVDK